MSRDRPRRRPAAGTEYPSSGSHCDRVCRSRWYCHGAASTTVLLGLGLSALAVGARAYEAPFFMDYRYTDAGVPCAAAGGCLGLARGEVLLLCVCMQTWSLRLVRAHGSVSTPRSSTSARPCMHANTCTQNLRLFCMWVLFKSLHVHVLSSQCCAQVLHARHERANACRQSLRGGSRLSRRRMGTFFGARTGVRSRFGQQGSTVWARGTRNRASCRSCSRRTQP